MSKKLLRAPVVAIQLSESSREDGLIEIQLLKTGNFFDPRYGKFSITRKMFSEMIENFNKKTRGIDIALDYAHETDGIAAGWFKDLVEKPIEGGRFGLFALTEPTPPGKKSLDEKTYKYVSADFDPNYKDNEEGKLHGCVLEGAALTNRPVVKGMQAVQLSELNEDDNDMMTLEEAMAEIKKLESEIALLKKPAGDDPMTPEETKRLSDLEAENAKLKADNSGLEEKVQLSEKNGKFDKMLSAGTVVEAQRKSFLSGDMAEFAEKSVKVKLSEAGTEEGNKGDADTVSTEKLENEMAEEVKALAKSENIQLSEATKRVGRLPKYASVVKR